MIKITNAHASFSLKNCRCSVLLYSNFGFQMSDFGYIVGSCTVGIENHCTNLIIYNYNYGVILLRFISVLLTIFNNSFNIYFNLKQKKSHTSRDLIKSDDHIYYQHPLSTFPTFWCFFHAGPLKYPYVFLEFFWYIVN